MRQRDHERGVWSQAPTRSSLPPPPASGVGCSAPWSPASTRPSHPNLPEATAADLPLGSGMGRVKGWTGQPTASCSGEGRPQALPYAGGVRAHSVGQTSNPLRCRHQVHLVCPGTKVAQPLRLPIHRGLGTDLAEGGDAYLNLPFQAWGTTSPSSHWQEREPDPQAGGQVHDQDARQESAS